MFVILTKDIKGVGFKNEVKQVNRGHFMNYLFPNGLAKIASKSSLKHLENVRQKEAMSAEEMKSKAEAIQQHLRGANISFVRKADAQAGTLFGSITEKDIASQINADFKLTLKPAQVILDEHIKHLGEKVVQVKLADGHQVDVRVTVKAQ